MSWALLPLFLALLARPAAALPSYFAKKMDGRYGAGNNCTRHPDTSSDLFIHSLGNVANQNITFIVTNAKSGAVVTRLCPGVTYSVTVSFGDLGIGHHLLTSTYGTFPSDEVCLSSSNACKNRVCPSPTSTNATHLLTMPCALPAGAEITLGVDNEIRASFGDGMRVQGNRVTYKFGGASCKPCAAASPSPSPVPSSPGPTRLIVRAESTTIQIVQGPTAGSTRVIVRLIGFKSDDAFIRGSLVVLKVGTTPPGMPLACTPAQVKLTKQANGEYRFVAKCTATAMGKARVKVMLDDPPALSGTSAVVTVTGLPARQG